MSEHAECEISYEQPNGSNEKILKPHPKEKPPMHAQPCGYEGTESHGFKYCRLFLERRSSTHASPIP